MAAIIECISATGQTLYSTIHDGSGNLWNGSAFEIFNSSNWSNYVNPLTEQTSTGYYKAAFPSGIAAGKYTEVLYQQGGGSPAVGDAVIGSGQIYWNGTTEEQGIAIAIAATPVTLAGSQPSINIGTVSTVTTIGTTGLAAIQAQILALLNSTAIPELTGIPASTPTLFQAMMLLFMSLRNNHTATSGSESIYNSAGTSITSAQLTDDGSTFTKGRFT
jgi:hypothetical protein